MVPTSTLLVGNGLLVTRDDRQPLIENGCVAIQNGLIVAVGPTAELELQFPGSEFIDAQGRLIMPGLINTHTHLYSSLARGMALKEESPANFVEILERLWWRLDRVLTQDDVYWSAMVGIIQSIRSGTTTLFDHHSSPACIPGSLQRIADAARQTGIRACLCYEVSDRDGIEATRLGIAENRAFLEDCRHTGARLLRGLFGLHASFTLSDETLELCREVVEEQNTGFHVHTAEAASDLEHCRSRYGKRIVERWFDTGILGSRTIAAHCVHVDDREIDLLQATGTNVIHNPESNMGNAVGCAPLLHMFSSGVHLGLGTDGYTADMFESMKAANLLHKHQSHDPGAAWAEPPALLFSGNAQIASECYGAPIGSLIPGACADVILVDYDPPTPLCASNLNSHILFGVSGLSVVTSIIGGRVVMRDRKLLGLDEREVMASARAAAAQLWRRF